MSEYRPNLNNIAVGRKRGYVCHKCRGSGVKLWREYNTSLDQQFLICAWCAGVSVDSDGRCADRLGMMTDQIDVPKHGLMVPAVPTEDGSAFWGYTSVPDGGVKWWRSLPSSK